MTTIRLNGRSLVVTIKFMPRLEIFFPVLKIRSISDLRFTISLLERLFLICNRKLVATLCPAASEDEPSSLRGHTSAEPELSVSFNPAGLVGSLTFVTHGNSPIYIA
jgi:hypothetical protein